MKKLGKENEILFPLILVDSIKLFGYYTKSKKRREDPDRCSQFDFCITS